MSNEKRHYELVFMVDADHSEQVPDLIKRYRTLIEGDGGAIHRLEDWGRRPLAYAINKAHKAHYVLMNIEASLPAMEELNRMFKFNDKVIRTLVMKKDAAITEPSIIAKPEDSDRRDSRNSDRKQSESAA